MRAIGAVAFLWLFSISAANAQLAVGNWSGLYLGGHFGAAWGDSDWFDLGAGNIGSHSASGIIGGAQLGYNFEMGAWVFGPQASLSGSSVSGKHLDAIFQFGAAPQHDQSRIDLLGTLTGRLGYAWGPLLLYGQGGATGRRIAISSPGSFRRGWNSRSATAANGAGPPGPGWSLVSRRAGRVFSNTTISASARMSRA